MLNISNMIFEDLDLSYLELFSLQEPLSYRYEDLGRFPHRGLHWVLMSQLWDAWGKYHV